MKDAKKWLPGAIISKVHGQPTRLPDGRTLMPMFHPAAALHQPKYRSLIEADFARIPALLQQLETAADQPAASTATPTPTAASETAGEEAKPQAAEPKQLSLF